MTTNLQMGLLVLLVFKHYLCDYPLQRPFMLAHKGEYGHWGGIAHALCHGGMSLMLLGLFSLPIWLALTLCFGECLVHYHTDWTKKQIEGRYHLDTTECTYWRLFGFDQLIHHLTYVVMVWIIGVV